MQGTSGPNYTGDEGRVYFYAPSTTGGTGFVGVSNTSSVATGASRKKKKKMRLFLLFFLPLCCIGLAWLAPVKRDGSAVSNTIAQIDELKPDSCEALCMAVKSNAKILRAEIAQAETHLAIARYKAIKAPPVHPVEVFDAIGRSQVIYIQKDTLKNEQH